MDQLKVFAKYRFLLFNLISRDLKVKYRRSVLGLVWSVLNPLLMIGVQYIVFSYLFPSDVPNFAVYLACGNLIFQFFSESTQTAMSSILGAAPLIKKVYIPKYIFPMEKILFSFVNTLFSSIALIIVAVITKLPLTWNLLFVPVPLIILTIFNLGIGLMLSASVVYFRDIMHLYGVLIMTLTYLTPIFYTENLIARNAPYVMKILKVNPMYWYVKMFREIVLYGNPPEMQQVLICSLFAILALVLGLAIFRKSQDKFILYV